MSATIYQFPAGRRARESGPAREKAEWPAVTPSVAPAVTACGAAWYHDEAIKEDEQLRER